MKNYEKLKEVNKQLSELRGEKEKTRENYYNNMMSQSEYYKIYEAFENKQRLLDIEVNILKNNLVVEVHNELMKIYKEVYKKYENKNIGEKRKDEIQNTLRKAINHIINDENEIYYNRFFLYFYVIYKRDEIKCFEISIDKIHYNFTYYLEDDEIKSYYNIELPQYIENIEGEATRLLNLYNEAITKKQDIEKMLDELKNNISSNFIKNLYNDDISKLNRCLTLQW